MRATDKNSNLRDDIEDQAPFKVQRTKPKMKLQKAFKDAKQTEDGVLMTNESILQQNRFGASPTKQEKKEEDESSTVKFMKLIDTSPPAAKQTEVMTARTDAHMLPKDNSESIESMTVILNPSKNLKGSQEGFNQSDGPPFMKKSEIRPSLITEEINGH